MNKLAPLLLLAAMPCMLSQSLKTEGLNVYVTRANRLFASNVSDLTHVDFANLRAVEIENSEWQDLRNGKGKSFTDIGEGIHERTEVWLKWAQALDDEHAVVDYSWFWAAGSSNSSEIVQLFELRDGKVYTTQQIETITHHGGRAVGAWFDANKKLLTVKAVASSGNGRCCPTHMNVVVFRWDGTRFRRISSKVLPLPEGN